MQDEYIDVPRITPPQILVENEDHDDPFAVFIMKHIYAYSKNLLESDKIHKHYARVMENHVLEWVSDINNGHCEGVVVYILDVVKESRFDSDRVRPKGRVKSGGNPLHYWIQYETEDGECYHFDAEAPWGVKDWKALPTIRRQLPYVLSESRQKDIDPRKDPNNTVRGFYGLHNSQQQPEPNYTQ